MPAVANVFGVHADILLKNRVCAGAGGWMQVPDARVWDMIISVLS
jgi:hypothetical protein